MFPPLIQCYNTDFILPGVFLFHLEKTIRYDVGSLSSDLVGPLLSKLNPIGFC